MTRSLETNGKHFQQERERIERRADKEPHAMQLQLRELEIQ
jgi:hypothetical protein